MQEDNQQVICPICESADTYTDSNYVRCSKCEYIIAYNEV